MTHLKNLTQAEQIELLHARIATIEAFLSQCFDGFFDDIENYAVNEIDNTNLTRQQKDILQATLLTIRSKYIAKGKKA